MMKIIFKRGKTNKNFLLAHFLFSLLFLLSVENLKVEPLQKTREKQVLQHEVSVTLKLVQTYVRDKHGNPVMDLEKSDFELYDNNKLQPITAFEKHVILSSPEKIEPPATLSSAPQDVSETMNRKFFLFFDCAFNNIGGITMSKKAALHFIDTQLVPTDEVGVLSYSTTKGLFLYEYLTTDHAKVREVIDQIGFKEILGRAGQFLEDLESIKITKSTKIRERLKALTGFKELARIQSDFESLQFSSALKDFAKALRYIPGYKYIIFFSIGIPGGALHAYLQHEKMLRELGASNSPVFVVNAEGLASRVKELEFIADSSPLSPPGGPAVFRFVNRAPNRDWSLQKMAKLTGGKYFGDTNDYEKIAQNIQNLTRSYYVLGYKIDEKWDGKYHRIKINVKRPGYDVFYPRGYFNPKPFAKYSDLEKKLHLIDLALAERPYFEDPIHFPLRTLASPMKQRSNLTLIAEIPLEKVREVSKEKLEIIMFVFDEKKNIVAQQKVETDSSTFSQDKIYFYSISYLPPGTYDCRVVMRNLKTGQGAVASSSIVIPERFDEGVKMYSPLILTPGKKGVYLSSSDDEKGQEKDKSYSTLVNFYPYDAEQYTPLIDEVSQDTTRLLVLLPCSIIRFEKPNMILSAHLVNLSSGKRKTLPLSLLGQQQEDDVITYTLELRTENLSPGKYTLYLLAEDSETQQPFTHVSCPLAVK